LPSDYGLGTENAIIDAQYRIAPLICWESAFGDLAQAQAANGARMFVISTDDAWFGASDGPYVHAQIASLRAIETGRWIVRAGATGISGVIAPDGTWRARGGLQTQEVVTGAIGDPQPTIYSRVGPHPFGIAFALLTIIAMVAGRRRKS
jgi:apolipoprotein N-acyltransferase